MLVSLPGSLDPWLVDWLGWCLALVLWPAAWHKLRHPVEFEQHLQAYRLLPERALPIGRVLPWLEWLAGGLLVAGPRPWGALLAGALLSVYAWAMAINLWRGRVLDCGCGGEPQPLSWGLVARNLLMIAMALAAAWPATTRSWQWTEGLLLALGVVAWLAMLAAVNQVLRQPLGARRVVR